MAATQAEGTAAARLSVLTGAGRIVVGAQVIRINGSLFDGFVRFVGDTEFAPGEWIGIELQEPTGKNDGTVKGVRYFECEPNHGLFVRRNMVEVKASTEDTLPSPFPQRMSRQASRKKSSSGLKSACLHDDGLRLEVDERGKRRWCCDTCGLTVAGDSPPSIEVRQEECDHSDGLREDVDVNGMVFWVCDTCKKRFPGDEPPILAETVQECEHADGFREDVDAYNNPVLVCDTCKKSFPIEKPPEAPVGKQNVLSAQECEHPDGLREDVDANGVPIWTCDTCKKKFPREAPPELAVGSQSVLSEHECEHPDGLREDVDANGAPIWICDACKKKYPREAPPEVPVGRRSVLNPQECEHPDGLREDVDANGAPIWTCDACKKKFPREAPPEVPVGRRSVLISQECEHPDGLREDVDPNGTPIWTCDACKQKFPKQAPPEVPVGRQRVLPGQECEHPDGLREDTDTNGAPIWTCDTCKKHFPRKSPPEVPVGRRSMLSVQECEHPDGLREDIDANGTPIWTCDACKKRFPREAPPEVSVGRRSVLSEQECDHPDGLREDVDANGIPIWTCDTCKKKFPREAPPEVPVGGRSVLLAQECEHPDGLREDVDANGAPVWLCDTCKRKFPREVPPEIGAKKQPCAHEDGLREDVGVNGERVWICDSCKERFTSAEPPKGVRPHDYNSNIIRFSSDGEPPPGVPSSDTFIKPFVKQMVETEQKTSLVADNWQPCRPTNPIVDFFSKKVEENMSEYLFNCICKDSDELIQKDELLQVLNSIGVELSEAELDAFTTACDTNGDGMISTDELDQSFAVDADSARCVALVEKAMDKSKKSSGSRKTFVGAVNLIRAPKSSMLVTTPKQGDASVPKQSDVPIPKNGDQPLPKGKKTVILDTAPLDEAVSKQGDQAPTPKAKKAAAVPKVVAKGKSPAAVPGKAKASPAASDAAPPDEAVPKQGDQAAVKGKSTAAVPGKAKAAAAAVDTAPVDEAVPKQGDQAVAKGKSPAAVPGKAKATAAATPATPKKAGPKATAQSDQLGDVGKEWRPCDRLLWVLSTEYTKSRKKVSDLFERMDKNNNKKVDKNELRVFLANLDVAPTREEIDDMMEWADKDGDGISLPEFEQGLKTIAKKGQPPKITMKKDIEKDDTVSATFPEILRFIHKKIRQRKCKPQDFCPRVDKDNIAQLNEKELKPKLEKLGKKATKEEIQAFLGFLDKKQDGSIALESLTSALKQLAEHDDLLAANLQAKKDFVARVINKKVQEEGATIASLFKGVDADGVGDVSRKELKLASEKYSLPIDASDINAFFCCADADDDTVLSLKEFSDVLSEVQIRDDTNVNEALLTNGRIWKFVQVRLTLLKLSIESFITTMDTESIGTVTKVQLREALEDIGVCLTTTEFAALPLSLEGGDVDSMSLDHISRCLKEAESVQEDTSLVVVRVTRNIRRAIFEKRQCELVRQLGADGSGKIRKLKLRSALMEMGLTPTDEDLDEFMDSSDESPNVFQEQFKLTLEHAAKQLYPPLPSCDRCLTPGCTLRPNLGQGSGYCCNTCKAGTGHGAKCTKHARSRMKRESDGKKPSKSSPAKRKTIADVVDNVLKPKLKTGAPPAKTKAGKAALAPPSKAAAKTLVKEELATTPTAEDQVDAPSIIVTTPENAQFKLKAMVGKVTALKSLNMQGELNAPPPPSEKPEKRESSPAPPKRMSVVDAPTVIVTMPQISDETTTADTVPAAHDLQGESQNPPPSTDKVEERSRSPSPLRRKSSLQLPGQLPPQLPSPMETAEVRDSASRRVSVPTSTGADPNPMPLSENVEKQGRESSPVRRVSLTVPPSSETVESRARDSISKHVPSSTDMGPDTSPSSENVETRGRLESRRRSSSLQVPEVRDSSPMPAPPSADDLNNRGLGASLPQRARMPSSQHWQTASKKSRNFAQFLLRARKPGAAEAVVAPKNDETNSKITQSFPEVSEKQHVQHSTMEGARAVQLELTIANLEYDKLVANSALVIQTKSAIRATVAKEAGPSIEERNVSVDLNKGSVKAKVTVSPPVGVEPNAVANILKTSTVIEANVTSEVANVPGIAEVASGNISVAVTSKPQVALLGNKASDLSRVAAEETRQLLQSAAGGDLGKLADLLWEALAPRVEALVERVVDRAVRQEERERKKATAADVVGRQSVTPRVSGRSGVSMTCGQDIAGEECRNKLEAALASGQLKQEIEAVIQKERLAPRPTWVRFRDPRSQDADEEVPIVAFHFPGHEEQCDKLCDGGFLGNCWDMGVDGIQLDAPCSPGEVQSFRNAAAAFQALRFWGKAAAFRELDAERALEMARQLEGEEDLTYGGYGSDWAAMLAVLRRKFSQGSSMAEGLQNSADAFLLEHNCTSSQNANGHDKSAGNSTNLLGMQLMLVRDELNAKANSPAAAADQVSYLQETAQRLSETIHGLQQQLDTTRSLLDNNATEIRDALTAPHEAAWTTFIQDECGVDLQSGQPAKLAQLGAAESKWHRAVISAAEAVQQRLNVLPDASPTAPLSLAVESGGALKADSIVVQLGADQVSLGSPGTQIFSMAGDESEAPSAASDAESQWLEGVVRTASWPDKADDKRTPIKTRSRKARAPGSTSQLGSTEVTTTLEF